MIFVPPRFAAEAILESADAGVPLVVCITEGIPVKDMAYVHSYLQGRSDHAGRVPTAPASSRPGVANVGIIPGEICCRGRVGLVSRSGTLVYQIVHELTQRGIGQSTCIGMGGDPVHGVGFIESLALFEPTPDTDLVVMTGEIGGDDEERAAAYIAEHVTKPVVGLHRRVRGAARQAHGPRRRDRHRVARGRRRPRPRRWRPSGVRVARTPTQVAELVAEALT